ncbi:hypothetical protein FGU71_10195 [Erythrobacter insulae]|uniref:Preprotein translocase subunit SecD n=1 Tax=Erythrobacter insulae TaxID=2584124 RepID=A0A547PDH5_9SPHN|nr:hypothetical protein [Erythrobacter insulae]TRD12193.1 hypothetical protein FGU71_10195 [Erythrobacter insulae]
MRRHIMPLMAMAALCACGAETSDTVTSEDGQEGEYSIDSDSGEATATIDTPEGTATFRSGADVPVDLPSGFALYPGATVTSNSRFDQETGTKVVLLSFESDDSPEAIADFYRESANKAGFEILVDATMNGGVLITGKGKSGGVFTLSTSTQDGKTSAQLTTGLGEVAP